MELHLENTEKVTGRLGTSLVRGILDGTVTKETSLLVFLETLASGPLIALGELQMELPNDRGAVIWKDSSLTSGSMNPAGGGQ